MWLLGTEGSNQAARQASNVCLPPVGLAAVVPDAGSPLTEGVGFSFQRREEEEE